MRRNRTAARHLVAPIFVLLLYCVLSFPFLDRVPVIHQDEAWIASPAWKLATNGVLGSDMFAGYYRMDERYYLNPPLHALLTAPLYRLAGVGLFQARWATVVMGAVVLSLTFALGKRWFDRDVGTLAMALLLFVSHASISISRVTGILFADTARVGRYDILVPIFFLLALCQFHRGRVWARGYGRDEFLTGVWVACAGLSNLYGLFAAGEIVLLMLWRRAGWRAYASFALGLALPLIPAVLYILDDPVAFAGQVRTHAPRFEVGRVAWYRGNLEREYLRYEVALKDKWWTRPGALLSGLALPVALTALAARARRGAHGARAPVVASLLYPLAFALLAHDKRVEYLAVVTPVWAIVLAWAWSGAWRRAKGFQGWRAHSTRVVLGLLLILVVTEGAVRYAERNQMAERMVPYADVTTALRTGIPPGSRVLGLHSYWFSFTDSDYRTWYTFLVLAGSQYTPDVRPLAESLDGFAPETILIDPAVRAYFAEPGAGQRHRAELETWMQGQNFRLDHVADIAGYGRFELYRRRTDD